jgi:hypothetical protein
VAATSREVKSGAMLRALLEGRDVKMGGQTYRLCQGGRDRTGRETFELGLLVLPDKDLDPQFMPTGASLSEFILLANSMTEKEYDVIAQVVRETPYAKRKIIV